LDRLLERIHDAAGLAAVELLEPRICQPCEYQD
jgi:hypothetical protein